MQVDKSIVDEMTVNLLQAAYWSWSLHFDFEYKPGRSHANVDSLSGRPPTEDIIATVHQLEMSTDEMKSAQLADKQLALIISALAQEKPLLTNSPSGLFRAFLQNGLFCWNFQPSSSFTEKVPSSMRTTILQQFHNNTCHLGVWTCAKDDRKCQRLILLACIWTGYG